ncbi:MAG: YfhO family protein, partial [Ignavibacteriales bacterium]|nr:YfhO family protein [Ignavibacteriales bacterium]
WETCLYVGIPAIVLIIFSLFAAKDNRYVKLFVGLSIFAMLYALGDNFILHKLFFNLVPGFDKFRSIGRITLLSTLSFSLLCGFGLQAFFYLMSAQEQKIGKVLLFIAGGAVLLWLAASMGFLQPSEGTRYYDQIHSMAVSETTTTLILVLGTIGVLFLISRRTVSPLTGIIGLIILLFVDVNIFGFNQNNGTTNPDEYYNRTANLVEIIKQEGQKEYFRVNSRRENSMILDRNQGMVDRIFMMEGYTPLALQRIYPPVKDFDRACDLLNAKFRTVVDNQNQTMRLSVASTFVPRAYFVYQTTIITDEEKIKEFMSSDSFDPLKIVVLEENPDLSLNEIIDSSNSKAEIISYSLNLITLKVSTRKNGYLVVSEIFYPGWNAYIDGKLEKVYRANWSLRAIPVRAGDHSIEIRFEPESFYRGAWITFITIGLSVIGIVYSFRTKKTPSDKSIKPL